MGNHNFYQLGFSKCGTSSIWDFFANFPPTSTRVLRTESGAIEFDLRKDLTPYHSKMLSEGGCYMKFSGAAFGRRVVENFHQVAKSFGEPVYILSVRSQKDVIASWFNMHKRMARNGRPTEHFAVVEREKYLNITIEEYTKIHLKKLDYATHINAFQEVIGDSRVYIFDFRNVKSGVSAVMGKFLEENFAGISYSDNFPKRNPGKYDDRIILPVDIEEKCNAMERSMDALLKSIDKKTKNLGMVGFENVRSAKRPTILVAGLPMNARAFAAANALFRDGCFAEAAALYASLAKSQPGIPFYENMARDSIERLRIQPTDFVESTSEALSKNA